MRSTCECCLKDCSEFDGPHSASAMLTRLQKEETTEQGGIGLIQDEVEVWRQLCHMSSAFLTVPPRLRGCSSRLPNSWSSPASTFVSQGADARYTSTSTNKIINRLVNCSNNANMAQVISNSGHDDMIHDAVLDYYGRRLATCSSDKTIKIFDIEGDQHKLTETLKG